MDLSLFLQKINMPSEAVLMIEKILGTVSEKNEFVDLVSDIENGTDKDIILEKANSFAQKEKFNEYEFALALICGCKDVMQHIFKEKGYSKERFIEAAKDFTFKANECKSLYGYYGNFVLRWSVRVIRGEIQKLGRLEFEEIQFDYDTYSYKEAVLHRGDRVLSVHIPTDGPLIMEDVMTSFKMAYNFYDCKHNGIMFVLCSSYLLYPPFVALYKKGSNMDRFVSLFDIIASRETETFMSAWRIFGTHDISDTDSLPKNTSLQKNMAQYLKDGGSVGAGTGIYPICS